MYGKEDIINKMAEDCQISKAEARRELDNVVNTLCDTLAGGNGFNIIGFAKFEVVDVAEHKGHNIKTGEVINIPAHHTIKAKVSKLLKDAVK